jgi:dienelactone hydrolase
MRWIAAILIGCVAASAWAIDAERATFAASDGHKPLVGDYFAPPRDVDSAPMVILLHMYRSDRSAWKPLIKPLHEAGFAVLAIDMRGHGKNANRKTRQRVVRRDPAVFAEMANDVRGAYDWLAKQDRVDRSRFAVVGASVGCSVALRYAGIDPSVDAVVCLTPGTDYLGLDSVTDAEKVKGRHVLLIANEDERQASDTLTPLIQNAAKKIYNYRKRAHGTQLFGKIDTVEDDIVEFLKRGVGSPTKHHVFTSIRSENRVYHTSDSEWIEKINPSNLRVLSSAEEAQARGLRKSFTKAPLDEDQ